MKYSFSLFSTNRGTGGTENPKLEYETPKSVFAVSESKNEFSVPSVPRRDRKG